MHTSPENCTHRGKGVVRFRKMQLVHSRVPWRDDKWKPKALGHLKARQRSGTYERQKVHDCNLKFFAGYSFFQLTYKQHTERARPELTFSGNDWRHGPPHISCSRYNTFSTSQA